MTSEGIGTSPKRKLHEGSHASNKASSGLELSAHLPSVITTTWATCMLGARRFPPLLTLPKSSPHTGQTFDASTLPEPVREQFHRSLRAVELVLAGATQTSVSRESGIPRSTLGRLVRRTRQLGQIACVPRGSYRGVTQLHPAFAERIRRLFLLPTRLAMTAILEHTYMQQVAARFS